jgi:hypothetical protein
MKLRVGFALLTIVILAGGCASPPQNPVPLGEDALKSDTGRMGVAMTPLPKADTHLRGAGCLLCIAVASAANSSLTSHAQTLSLEDLPKLKNEVAELLRRKGGCSRSK